MSQRGYEPPVRRGPRACPICFPTRPPHRMDYWARAEVLKILRPIDEIIASVFEA